MSEEQEPSAARGSGTPGTRGWRDRLTPARWSALVLVALAVVLIAENTRQVKIRLLVPVVTMPLYAALLIMFVIGVLSGGLLAYQRNRRRRARMSRSA